MQRHLLYQAYGHQDILHELIYSVYSVLRQYEGPPPFEIVVYTDSQEYLQRFLPPYVVYQPLTAAQIKEWRGEIDFVHRVKVMMIRDFMAHRQGTALYLDTDTVLTQPIQHLFELLEQGKTFIMHENEGIISSRKNIIFKKVDIFLRSHPTHIPSDTVMFNAGVLGFRTTDRAELDNVLETTDQLYQLFRKHIVEQLAFSFHLNAASEEPIYTATSEVFHYWDFKEFRGVLQEFFEFYQGQPYEKIVAKMESVNPQRLIIPKREYASLSFLPKMFRKIFSSSRWQLPPYQLS